jgi:hypothetical protein
MIEDRKNSKLIYEDLETELEIKKQISQMFTKIAIVLKKETIEKQNFKHLISQDNKLCALALLGFRAGMPKDIIQKLNKVRYPALIIEKNYGLKKEMLPVLHRFYKKRKEVTELNDSKLSYNEIGSIMEIYAKEILTFESMDLISDKI